MEYSRWYFESDDGTTRGMIAGEDGAARPNDDVVNDRQAEPGSRKLPGRIRSVEPVEDVPDIGTLQARATVSDGHPTPDDGYVNGRTGWAELDCVVQQVRRRSLKQTGLSDLQVHEERLVF